MNDISDGAPPATPLRLNCSPVDAFLAAGGLPGRITAQTGRGGAAAALLEPAEPAEAGAAGGPAARAGGQRPPAEAGPTTFIQEHKARSDDGATTYGGFDDRLGEALETRRERHGKQHWRALEMATYCASLAPHRAEKLRTCGAWLQFREYYTAERMRLTAGMFCQQYRLCPLCAYRRAGRLLRKTIQALQTWMSERAMGDLHWSLVTLTIKNRPDLGEATGHVLKNVRDVLRRRRDFLSNQRKGFACAPPAAAFVCAGVGSVEIKRGKNSGQWHPHYHGLWASTVPVDVEQLRAEWRELTGDSHVVDVRPFNFSWALHDAIDNGADELPEITWDVMAADFVEVFKYPLKFGDMPVSDNWHAYEVLFGKRLFESFGELRGKIQGLEPGADEPLSADMPYIEFLMRFKATDRAYVVKRQEHFECDPRLCCKLPDDFLPPIFVDAGSACH